jgi:protein O-GlcNAc transferase
MALYDRLDIALDTIPFNGGTTTFDALWMGVPMVALEGNWVGGMLGSSVLKAFDRPEWVAQDQDEYVSIVCSLAHDVAGRTRQRKMQRSRMRLSPLCDAKEMARCMEDTLEGMYDLWMAGGKMPHQKIGVAQSIGDSGVSHFGMRPTFASGGIGNSQ